jgi:hypothetical protein
VVVAMHPGADRNEVSELLNNLASDAAAGSAEALDTLLQVIDDNRLANATVRRFILNEELVDEATQDTLIATAESIHKFRGSRSSPPGSTPLPATSPSDTCGGSTLRSRSIRPRTRPAQPAA